MIEQLLLKLRARDEISVEEEEAIRLLPEPPGQIGARRTLINAGETLDNSILLVSGLMCRYKDLRNGERQIMELHVPGDFVDLHSFTLKRLDHSLLALTSCTYATVPHVRLAQVTADFPHLARMFWFSTNLDAAIHRAWMLSLGRRTAIARIAHLFIELLLRLELIRMTEGNSYALPLTQDDLAECLGMTAVHVNRMLKQLRDRDLVTFRSGRVVIHNLEELKAVAEFEPDYLYLEKRPR